MKLKNRIELNIIKLCQIEPNLNVFIIKFEFDDFIYLKIRVQFDSL